LIKAKMAQKDTVAIEYVALCGKHEPRGFTKKYTFEAQAPASLCVEKPDTVEDGSW
jgi:hypothetical protein